MSSVPRKIRVTLHPEDPPEKAVLDWYDHLPKRRRRQELLRRVMLVGYRAIYDPFAAVEAGSQGLDTTMPQLGRIAPAAPAAIDEPPASSSEPPAAPDHEPTPSVAPPSAPQGRAASGLLGIMGDQLDTLPALKDGDSRSSRDG